MAAPPMGLLWRRSHDRCLSFLGVIYDYMLCSAIISLLSAAHTTCLAMRWQGSRMTFKRYSAVSSGVWHMGLLCRCASVNKPISSVDQTSWERGHLEYQLMKTFFLKNDLYTIMRKEWSFCSVIGTSQQAMDIPEPQGDEMYHSAGPGEWEKIRLPKDNFFPWPPWL